MRSTRLFCAAAAGLMLISGCPVNAPDPDPVVIACWDLNGNSLADDNEDTNGDGVVDVLDCRGQDGIDGTQPLSRLYGDGSSGSRVIESDTRFETAADANRFWTNFTISEGATLRLQSGTVIRCSGSFINRGTVIIEHGAQGGDRSGFDLSALEGNTRVPSLGINTLAASNGEVGNAAEDRSGGSGGDGISEFEALGILRLSLRAGSGGGAALGSGGAGGGGVTILAGSTMENFGTIVADGADAPAAGGGGGGGGVILLAAGEAIRNYAGAELFARGGAGGPASAAAGPGGGGGGGIVHLIAPSLDNPGEVSIVGGAGGQVPPGMLITEELRSGGGGGGGSAGVGGAGGGIPGTPSTAPLGSGSGTSGFFLTTLLKPEQLWF